MAETHSVGVPTPRIDGEYKVSGKAKYAVDIALPDMLWGKILRSPISSARIKSIDTSKAMQVPGVVGILTGEDVAGLRIGRRVVDMPIVADGLVRFIGEKVAAVSAETEDAAEKAAADKAAAEKAAAEKAAADKAAAEKAAAEKAAADKAAAEKAAADKAAAKIKKSSRLPEADRR